MVARKNGHAREWRNDGGNRDIDYPFYSQVVHIDIIDRVYETILRSGGNRVIPASFVDVMNEPEANLVRRAAQRGLFVTQHHVEPVGVSHFGFPPVITSNSASRPSRASGSPGTAATRR